MSLLKAIILGIVQGLTEFLPVSSSGHLVIVGELMDVELSAMFAIAVHVGTLFSVLIYFRKQLWALFVGLFQRPVVPPQRMVFYLAVGTIPAVVLGLSFMDFFERVLTNEIIASSLLCVTGLILLLPNLVNRLRGGTSNREVKLSSAVIMGIGQAIAILPGISRSGSTIASGMLARVNPSKAAEFSFLLAIPVIAGGAVFEFGSLPTTSYYEVLGVEKSAETNQIETAFQEKLAAAGGDEDQVAQLTEAHGVLSQPEVRERYDRSGHMPFLLLPCLAGAIVAFLSGLFAIYAVLDTIRRGKFEYFAVYCFIVGVGATIYFGFIKG